ncbi:hypothetical protein PR048_021077 [Dryococelus australis]|uniref:Uncharacterized protein n=1 Tax=Dryococelus australis TaxID=614101 RepID=A0ABQ9GX77_9NEOP|nr:hypothetical protein PR048_021077 [Dryococelus australis]
MIIARGKNPGVGQAGINTLATDSISEEYIESDVLKTAGVFTEVENNCEIKYSDCLPDTQPPPFDEPEISEECNEDGLRYLAGWVCADVGVCSHKTKVVKT